MMWKQTLTILALIGGLAGSIGAAPSAEKPNIILIISDDQRWDCLGIAGAPHLKTPNFDRMAREGQWYREATIQISTCSASRAAILTGLAPAVNGWYSNQQQRKDLIDPHGFDQYKLLPKEMENAGYRTAMVGKWHISPDPWLCGFQSVRHWMEAGAGKYKNARLSDGKVRASKPNPGFTQTVFTDDAIDELKKSADSHTTQPLFLWLAYTAPHNPFTPNPKPFDGMYQQFKPRELAPCGFHGDPDKTAHGKHTWQNYYEAISSLDHQVGRLMDTIRDSNLSTNTLVFFLGDNGFFMGSRGLHGKYLPYEEAARVPLIVWGSPDLMVSRGTTVTACVNSLDLSPTFVRLAGATPPSEWPGRDFSQTIKDGQTHGLDWAVVTYPDHSNKLDHVNAYRMIRTNSHKLITWHPATKLTPELYDLKSDPAESKNLYDDPALKATRDSLSKQLQAYLEKSGDTVWDMKGPVVDFQTRLPDGSFANTRAAARKSKNAD